MSCSTGESRRDPMMLTACMRRYRMRAEPMSSPAASRWALEKGLCTVEGGVEGTNAIPGEGGAPGGVSADGGAGGGGDRDPLSALPMEVDLNQVDQREESRSSSSSTGPPPLLTVKSPPPKLPLLPDVRMALWSLTPLLPECARGV